MGGVAACVFVAGCEGNHTHVRELALIRSEARPPQSGEDRTDERAADGLLVVQVCHLRPVSREVSLVATPVVSRHDVRALPDALNRAIFAKPSIPDAERPRLRAGRGCCARRSDRLRRAGDRDPKGETRPGAIKKVNAISAKLRGWRTEIPCREFEYRSETVSSHAVSGRFLPISDLRLTKNQLSPYSYWR
jgi:hypothetical protein